MSRKKKKESSINETVDTVELHSEEQQEAETDKVSEDVKLEDEILKLKEQLQQEQDKKVRLMAEYDNYRKRTQNEFAQLIVSANARLIKQLLPVLDDFDRLFSQDKDSDNSSVILGVEMIHRKFQAALEAEGLKPIIAKDALFDAELHEAIAQIENDKKPAGTVISEVEKGYLLGNNIIRHAKVVVSKEAIKETEDTNE